jgi:hypothetical protein
MGRMWLSSYSLAGPVCFDEEVSSFLFHFLGFFDFSLQPLPIFVEFGRQAVPETLKN